jgi:hypothetical protein
MSPRRKPKGEILTPIPEEDSNLSTTSEAENKSNKKEKINENIRRRRLGRALMATEVHCKTRMAMIVWRVCKAYTSSTSSSSDHTRTSDLSSILRTWCSSAKRENISFLIHLLRLFLGMMTRDRHDEHRYDHSQGVSGRGRSQTGER